jgi:hypothetical protein
MNTSGDVLFETFAIIVLSCNNPKPTILFSWPSAEHQKDDTLSSLPQFCFPDDPFAEPEDEDQDIKRAT